MTLDQIAALIPAVERKEILEQNMVGKARPDLGNKNMQYLSNVWKKHVDCNLDTSCPLCMVTVLNNYSQILPSLIKLEKESKLLESL